MGGISSLDKSSTTLLGSLAPGTLPSDTWLFSPSIAGRQTETRSGPRPPPASS
eukprot:CAMPEP_0181497762 /NCGR_PEP_ID=MMETSP1110-20121109/53715_1 /TAXON_ID=174948 /ORGANISM="Symbiodinium sp., Strain CCMP421" /LENGTH=52 /DNA_ID=CAMNT_0023625737 /DNA_START=42 /DNA_END=196 /DNA_ORIENTATION=-